MLRFLEKSYPYIFALVAVGVAYLLKFNPKIKGLDNVLDGFISFSSIVLGFIAALLAIILSISQSAVMNHLYSYVDPNNNDSGKTIMFGYFKAALLSGFITVILSIFSFIIIDKEKLEIYDKVILYIWVGFAVYFICSSYRIVSTLMHVLFKHEVHESSSYEQSTLPTDDYEQLRERNIRNID